MDELWRVPIEQLGERLRTLHAALVALEREAYERRNGPVTSGSSPATA